MGYDPSNEVNNRYFTVGFDLANQTDATAQQSAERQGMNATSCAANKAAASGETYFNAGKGNGDAMSSVTAITNSTINTQAGPLTQAFIIAAAGVVSIDFTTVANMSNVTVDQDKMFVQVQPGY